MSVSQDMDPIRLRQPDLLTPMLAVLFWNVLQAKEISNHENTLNTCRECETNHTLNVPPNPGRGPSGLGEKTRGGGTQDGERWSRGDPCVHLALVSASRELKCR